MVTTHEQQDCLVVWPYKARLQVVSRTVNSTSHRAHLSRATHAIFLVCTWLEFWSPAPVAILAQAISCSNVRGDYPVHELFWFCLVQVSTAQFCSFSSFLMSRASDGTDVPVSPVPASSSNMGSPNGSLPDLDGVGGRSTSTMEEKFEGHAY